MKQSASKIFMVNPLFFGFNEETAQSNVFQRKAQSFDCRKTAVAEFKAYAKLLEDNGIDVIIADDSEKPFTPDSVFPNNWFSTHEDGKLVLYPMFAPNRRQERKPEFLKIIENNFNCTELIDLTTYEKDNLFLEGTGSLVLDRTNKTAYACKSVRTSEAVLNEFCSRLGFRSIIFDASDENDAPIYHTNVMMSIGEGFAVICLSSIKDKSQAEAVISSLKSAGKDIIEISLKQMASYAGNCLQLKNKNGENILVMSATAFESLNKDQISTLNQYCRIVTPDIPTIESIGGGSARCMLAEIF